MRILRNDYRNATLGRLKVSALACPALTIAIAGQIPVFRHLYGDAIQIVFDVTAVAFPAGIVTGIGQICVVG